jgi:uncharacterized protein (TIGR02301 family)
MNLISRALFVCILLGVFAQPTMAIDPPYQSQMQQLLKAIGSLYFLHPLCGNEQNDWRQHANELIMLDEPTQDRRQRLNGAFNQGYYAYARLHQSCTFSARQAITQLLVEADHLTRDIHSRYAE